MDIPSGVEIVSTERVSEHVQRIRVRTRGATWAVVVKSYEGVSGQALGGRAWISPEGTGMSVERAIETAIQHVLAIETGRRL